MNSNILPRPTLPLMNIPNQNILSTRNPILTNGNINSIYNNSIYNTINPKTLNISQNALLLNGNNNPNYINSYNKISNVSSIKGIPNTITNNNKTSKINKSKSFLVNKSRLLSSGTLVSSKKSKKYDKVTKNGEIIENIDINGDSSDPQTDLDTISTNSSRNRYKSFDKNKLMIYNGNLNNKMQLNSYYEANNIQMNNSQLIGNTLSKTPNQEIKLNPIARFINYIIDKINPNIKLNNRSSDPYEFNNQNNISLNSTYNESLNKSSQILNSTNPTNTQLNNNLNNTNNDNKSSENLSKNNTITNVNQNKITPNPPIIPPIKSPVISSIKDPSSSKIPLDNDSNLNLSDKKSHTTKEEISKRSESKTSSSKFPFQPLKDIITSPKTDRKISFNSNISNSDNYLPSHLGEYIRNESTPNPISIQDIMNQKKGKGFKCYSQITLAGREADGKLKTNQDTPLVCISVGGIVGFNMFGVLDGHGPQGHFVSQFCKDYFIRNMKTYTILLRTQKGISNAEAIYFELKNTKFNFIVELFTHVDVQLASQKSFDCILSGTTCNIIFQFNKHLICCSVGDSRGILVYDKGQYMGPGILALSTDHKPDMPGEMERITMCGGEIDSLKDMYGNRIGPPRVFKLGSDYPGLAMSRSLGDLLGKEVGVSPVPQIIEYDIDFSTKYFVICSDGVWEFSSNEQVRDIGNMYYALNDVAGFCSQILKLAMDLWNQINFVRDDITIVSVFF